MSRPVAIQDSVILQAARAVFLKRGYRASTLDVARKAGVSEGSLFKRFRTKSELFLAAMSGDVSRDDRSRQDALMGGVGRNPVRAALERYGRDLLAHLQLLTPRIMMVNASGITFAKPYLLNRRPPPLEHIAILTNYFRSEQKLGRLRIAAPEAQAHLFIGALSHYVFCEAIFGYRSATPRVYVRNLVDTVLRDALPKARAADRQDRPEPKPRRSHP
jgi:AcrR family transcriptional regulator